MKEQDEDWTMVIKPSSGLFDLQLKEVWRYRDLLQMFVRRDFVAVYKQTILGPIWFFLQPLFTTITFTIVFGKIAGMSTNGVPPLLFYMAGIVGWNYFAECLNTTSTTFIQNANIFGKVYFPRLIMPLSIIVSNLLKFGVQLILFLVLLGYYIIRGADVQPNIYLLLVPFLVLLMAGLGLGFGMLISAMTTKYRDLKFLVGFGVQLAMYASPVIYPLSTLPEKYKIYIAANPMSGIIEAFRFAFLGSGTLNWNYLIYSTLFTLVIFILGVITFNKVEKSFMDTV
ncbi:ABC transporter permease [Pontibacter sp. E15-1]|uniref:ABC transporter permease n=1 Tax=Pontibacter sp. E15-1 TaxID=2919918 RepID=UPI001F50140D|nr:ABC transporter permease [Pontibacter sp. E15-1]MCJ8166327.1 ABC transporter permease [Pontibacter sp. E15-1]